MVLPAGEYRFQINKEVRLRISWEGLKIHPERLNQAPLEFTEGLQSTTFCMTLASSWGESWEKTPFWETGGLGLVPALPLVSCRSQNNYLTFLGLVTR